MSFTFSDYRKMIELLNECGYMVLNYNNYKKCKKGVILRHDVDTDLNRALILAKLEHNMGVNSTYFLRLSSDFYNLCSRENRKIVNEIGKEGHSIGLHFDESVYSKDTSNTVQIIKKIKKEVRIMSELLERDIKCFSYHRPSQTVIQSDIELDGLINVYGKIFFRDFKYLSDSRMHWREPVLDIIKSKKYERLHILTHPFWYQSDRMSMKEIIFNYVSNGNIERYNNFRNNITNLEDIIQETEI